MVMFAPDTPGSGQPTGVAQLILFSHTSGIHAGSSLGPALELTRRTETSASLTLSSGE